MTTHTGTATELGTLPIRKLLTQYSIPGIIAMTAASLYNMIDSIYIGQGVGAMAISGLALTFPFMNLAAAFGSLVGVGAATLISVRLGQKDYDTAQSILGNVVLLNVIIGLAFGFISLIFLDPILYFFGASDSTIGYARDFMRVILLGNVITHMYLGLNGVLRASGHPKQAMIATINTVVFNAILAPIFIYGFKWGIEGARTSTCDEMLRPAISPDQFPSLEGELSRFVARLAHIHREHPALCTGSYEELFLTNRQYAYSRTLGDERIAVLHNIDEAPFSFSVPTGGNRALDLLAGEEIPLENGRLELLLDG